MTAVSLTELPVTSYSSYIFGNIIQKINPCIAFNRTLKHIKDIVNSETFLEPGFIFFSSENFSEISNQLVVIIFQYAVTFQNGGELMLCQVTRWMYQNANIFNEIVPEIVTSFTLDSHF